MAFLKYHTAGTWEKKDWQCSSVRGLINHILQRRVSESQGTWPYHGWKCNKLPLALPSPIRAVRGWTTCILSYPTQPFALWWTCVSIIYEREEKTPFFTQICGFCFLFWRDAMEKLHSMDDAFKKQVDAIVLAHQTEIMQLASEKQKYIDSANLKVL